MLGRGMMIASNSRSCCQLSPKSYTYPNVVPTPVALHERPPALHRSVSVHHRSPGQEVRRSCRRSETYTDGSSPSPWRLAKRDGVAPGCSLPLLGCDARSVG